MGVGQQAVPQGLRPDVAGEGEGVRQEETLQRRLAGDEPAGAERLGLPEGVQRDRHAADVGDVLAEGQLAVDAQAGQRLLPFVLGDDPVATLAEGALRRGRPALLETAGRTEAPAGVVETMGELMADRAGDETVEHGVVEGVAVVGRHAEDGGGHHDLVVQWAVVGVDRVGAHAPLLAFRGAADAGERPGARPPADIAEVLGEAVGADLHAFVAAELVGITHAQLDRGELAQGPRLRLGIHPLQLADAGGEGGPHVLADQAEPFALRRGEAARHVFLAEQVAQGAVLDP